MENLENIKVGDEVVLYIRYNKILCKVERLTKNFIIVKGRKYRKSNGFSTNGDILSSSCIYRASTEMIAKIKEENNRNILINKIRHYPLDKLSTKELEKVYELINK